MNHWSIITVSILSPQTPTPARPPPQYENPTSTFPAGKKLNFIILQFNANGIKRKVEELSDWLNRHNTKYPNTNTSKKQETKLWPSSKTPDFIHLIFCQYFSGQQLLQQPQLLPAMSMIPFGTQLSKPLEATALLKILIQAISVFSILNSLLACPATRSVSLPRQTLV